MTVLLLVLPPSGPYYLKFRRTSSAVSERVPGLDPCLFLERWVRERETYFFSLLGSCIVSKDRACDLMPREGAKQVKKSAWLVGTNVLNWPYTQALVEKIKCRAALVPLA